MDKGLKYGCAGCAGVLALGVVFLGGAAGLAWLELRGEELRSHVIHPEVPQIDPSESAALGAEGPAGRMVLDMYHADLDVVPAPAGEALRVESAHDDSEYEFRESLENDAEEGWSYRVDLKRRGPAFMVLLKQLMGARRPRLRIHLPADAVRDLRLSALRGNSTIDLGGLWLKSAELDVSKGGLQLSVSEPLKVPMERLAIDSELGAVSVSSLGDASPRSLRVTSHLGALNLDLGGAWSRDADIRIAASVGGTIVRLPAGVRIEGLTRPGTGPAADPEVAEPTLRFTVEANDLQIVD